MDESPLILRIRIEGRWTVDEMARSFRCLNNLYNLRLALQIAEDRLYEASREYRRRGLYPFELLEPFFTLHQIRTHTRLYEATRSELQSLISNVDPEDELQVRRVSYASPGNKDLLGLGAVIEGLGKFVVGLIRLPQDLQMRKEHIKAQQIQNARDFVKLRRESAEADRDIRNLTRFAVEQSKPLTDLIEQEKLTGIELLPDDQESGSG